MFIVNLMMSNLYELLYLALSIFFCKNHAGTSLIVCFLVIKISLKIKNSFGLWCEYWFDRLCKHYDIMTIMIILILDNNLSNISNSYHCRQCYLHPLTLRDTKLYHIQIKKRFDFMGIMILLHLKSLKLTYYIVKIGWLQY